MSLRARLLVGMAVIVAVVALAALVITRSTEQELVGRVDRQLTATVALREDRPPFRAPADGGSAPPIGWSDRPDERLSAFYEGVVGDDDEITTRVAPNLDDDDPLPTIDAEDARAAALTGEAFTVGSTDEDVRYRVMAGIESATGETFVIALPLDDVDATLRRLMAVEATMTGAVLAVAGLVSWWVIHLGLRPLKRMTSTASAIAAGNLAHRVPEGRPRTEAGELSVALNQMLECIEESFDERTRSEERLRRFVADASHELRTPVTTIRGYCELYASGGLTEPDALTEAMRRTGQEAVRMGGLVDDLLLLARLDRGRPAAHERVDLAALASDAARDARAVAPERTVTLDADAALVVHGDPDRLRQVLANVVGNALVHTSPTVDVAIRARGEDGAAVVEVTDHGQGMPPDVAARAFERFFRADPARSRRRGGSGLGLAIVDAAVTAHGGRVSLTSTPGHGTTVRLALPLAGPRPGRR